MKPFRCFLIAWLTGASLAGAAVINDGTSIDGLIRLANTVSPGATTDLVVTPEANLSASASQPLFTFPFVYTAWYADAVVATGATYTVSADFLPTSADERFQGGVIGWLDEESTQGFIFHLVPGGASPGVEVRALNAGTGVRSFIGLYDTNGIPASDISTGWRSALEAGYHSTNFATLELAFSLPTVEDLAALSNATARITARILQDNGSGPGTVSEPITLLTDLAVPPPDQHRFGYYAVHANQTSYDGPIGRLDNLTVNGDIGAGNQRPIIALIRPAPGASFFAPATITIEAEASDPDANGSIASVAFYEGANLLGTRTAVPYTWDWTGVAAGTYTVTAVATDNLGASRTSDPLEVTVQESSGIPPTLSVSATGNTLTITWDQPGYTLESSTDLGTTWSPVNSTGAQQHVETMSGSRKFFRLVSGGQVVRPQLQISAVGDTITITGIQSGFTLESTTDLGSGWTPVVTSGSQYSETLSGPRKFFQLKQ
jgi:hypothetical protein